MMKFRSTEVLAAIGSLVIATTLSAGCAQAEEAPNIPAHSGTSATPSPASLAKAAQGGDIRAVTEANNRFAFALYHQLRSAGPDHLFFSPASISIALAMTYAGARGKTELEMASTLGFKLEPGRVNRAFASLLASVNDPEQESYQLHVANRLWVQAGYKFLPEYLATTREHYRAAPVAVDFVREREQSRQTINTWVEEQTAGKIRDLVPRDALDAQTRLVLTNAVYFKGNWAKQFDKAATRPAPFHVSREEQVEVPLMHQTSRLAYGDAGSLQVAVLPYEGDDLSMVVLLPKEISGLPELEKSLSADNLEKWLAGARPQEVQIYLPRFKMEAEFQLAGSLTALGMGSAFGAGADFSGIDGTRNLYLSAAIHKAFVDVNEEGTEAAAATAVMVQAASASPPPPVFRADRPFVFLIRHDPTGSILFLGRVKRP